MLLTTKYKLIILILLTNIFYSCSLNKKRKDNDYDVINQILMKYGSLRVCICDYIELPDYWRDGWYPIKRTNEEKKEIIKLLKRRKINTENINLTHYKLLLIRDSIRGFKYPGFRSKKAIKLDLDKMIIPKNCILYQSNSVLNKPNIREKRITLTRVLFNKNHDKAVFGISFYFSGLDGYGFTIFAELKNGTWIIKNIKGNYVS